MNNADLKTLLKRVVELVMPNLRHYYRLPRKGLVTKSYASDGSYWADVQVLRNDESPDPAQPLLKRVAIPVMWAGPRRGVVCPPVAGAVCDVTWYDGDPNYPCISNFRWSKGNAPNCELGAFVIQQGPQVYYLIGADGHMRLKSPEVTVEGNLIVTGTVASTGNISSAAQISDGLRSMAADRGIFNGHHHNVPTHGASAVPTEQM